MEVFVEIEIMYHQYVKRQKLCIGNTYVKRPLSLATRTVVNSQKRKVTKEKRKKWRLYQIIHIVQSKSVLQFVRENLRRRCHLRLHLFSDKPQKWSMESLNPKRKGEKSERVMGT